MPILSNAAGGAPSHRAGAPAGTAPSLQARARQAWSAPRSPRFVILVLSIWLTGIANLSLWRELAQIDSGGRGLLVGVVVAGILFAVIAAFLSLTAWSRWMKPVWLAVVLAAAVSQHYMLSYGIVIDATMLANVFATNVGEAFDLFNWTLLGNVALVWAPVALWLVPLRVTGGPARREVSRALLLGTVSLAAAVAGVAASFSVLAPLVRNHMHLRYLPNPPTPFVSLAKVALTPILRRPRALVSTSAGAALGPSYAAGGKPPLFVLVIGETARADHFALNGYGRDTTPDLAAAGVLSFRNVWSCGTNTLASVPCMFSSLGKARFAGRDAEHENLLDVLQAAGLAVLWLDNQSGCKGVCDRVASASTADLAGTPAAARLCSDGECLDEALLVGLDARIAALPAERRRHGVVVVMHQMGSHGPAYGRRSPASSKRFQPECARTTLGECDRAELINAYDNTIAYTDHVLARTIGWLQARSASFAPAMLYVSDHGESLGEFGIFLHGLPYPIAPDAQKRVPLIAWLGDELAGRGGIDRKCLAGRLDQPLSHDHLYHSVLGLLDVRTPTFDPKLDLWGACKPRHES
jgi:lipid A ethanolaminephosphotransferase